MRAYKQLSKNFPNIENSADVDGAMLTFKALEDANVPREWTGKLYKSVRQSEGLSALPPEMYAKSVSDAMRKLYVSDNPELTKTYRETFLSLLPAWYGSMDELAETARSL
jgi:hypothetical protein